MSRLSALFPRVVDVLADERVQVEPPIPAMPDVGLCWGQPSQFEHGMTPEPHEAGATLIRFVDTSRVLKGTETHREFGEHAPVGDATFEGIKSVTFFLGTRQVRHESRKVTGSVTVIEPTIETIEEYVKFDFSFEVMGSRGEPHPAETIGFTEITDFSLEPFDLGV